MATQKDIDTSPAPSGETPTARRDGKVYAGGNPAFDERQAPKGERPRKGRVYAGGNPWFDERKAPAPKP